jgi:alkanesulfonate monooxygenase SsuD/methylene tetrahydromethanopterin reductase-like flavin-dependent oxidoreductase (luciferase family)
MKFGIFFELSTPKPWRPDSEYQVYMNALEQAQLADELGFDQIWAVEHHFLEEYSHCSAPEVFLTAVAMRTKRARIGHGVVLCLPPLNHPIRIAERAAALDIVSGGRLEFGTGRSATWTELGGFGVDPDMTKEMWDECVRVIPKMWTQEAFGYQGKFFSMPPRNVIPKPYQKPHPPMWVAVTSPETAIQAAERGLGLLGVSVGTPKEYEERVNEYRRRIRECEPVGEFVNEQVNGVTFMYVDESEEEARYWGSQLVRAFAALAAQFPAVSAIYPTPLYKVPGLLFGLRREQEKAQERAEATAAGTPGQGARSGPIREGMAIGDPETVIKQMKLWEALGMDRMVFLLNMGEAIPQEKVLKSLRLFAEHVMPKFDREAPAAKASAKPAAGAQKSTP